MTQESLALAKQVTQAALDGLAENITLLEMNKVASFCDYFIICQGRSASHVEAIYKRIEDALRDSGIRPTYKQGERSSAWAVLDYGDLVIHIFDEPARIFYDIEGLWADAKRIELDMLSGTAD